jgi:hypothetical protein
MRVKKYIHKNTKLINIPPYILNQPRKQKLELFNNTRIEKREDARYYGYSVFGSKSSYNIYRIKFATNNIFCHLFNNLGKTIYPPKSFGNYKIKVSKKNKHKHVKELMQNYSDELISKKYRKRAITPIMAFSLQVNRRMRGRITRWVKGMIVSRTRRLMQIPFKNRKIATQSHSKQILFRSRKIKKFDTLKRTFIFEYLPQKPFNGCRGIKMRRKKRLYKFFKKRGI